MIPSKNRHQRYLPNAANIICLDEHSKDYITEIKRISTKTENKVSPVLIELRSWNLKMQILRKAKKLKGTKIYINEDYPKEILKKQLALMEHLKIARNKGLKARLV